MTRPTQVAVIGGGADDPALEDLAEEVGRQLARAGARVVCGGLGGVMEGASRGAARAGGDVVGIVPGVSTADANEWVTHPVAAGTGQARNLAVVASADAVIAIGGAWGTLSEIALARRLGRPVVALSSWELREPAGGEVGIEVAAGATEAVAAALRLVA